MARPPGHLHCSAPGCRRRHYAKGFCRVHYRQQRKGQELKPPRAYLRMASPRSAKRPARTGAQAPVIRQRGIHGDPTAAEVDAMIAEQMRPENLPWWWPKYGRADTGD